MGTLLSKTKATLQETFKRISEILTENGINSEKVNMKVGFYRNYDSPDKNSLWQSSNWESKSASLK